MSVQGAIGFGFAFFVAPAAFAAFPAPEAVMLVLLLAVAINFLVLFTERRRTEIAVRETSVLVIAGIPGLAVGAWVVTEVAQDLLQLLVGVIVLVGAAVQGLVGARSEPASRPRPSDQRAPLAEVCGGLAAGVLTTSVSINGPALVLTFSHLGLRGTRLRDSLAAALLGLTVPAIAIVILAAGAEQALPEGWVLLACVPALVAGHRFGASVFRRLDDASHHRAALVAAAIAGLLSIGAALL